MALRIAAIFLMGVLVQACTATEAAPSTSATAQASAGTPSVAPSVHATVAPSASSIASAPTITWSEQPFDGDVHAASVDRGRFVAVGRVGQQLTAWTSEDAATWQASDVPDPTFVADAADVFGPGVYEKATMGPIARLGETLYSLGTYWGDNDFVRPVGWRLSDGGAWEYIESESAFFEGLLQRVQRGSWRCRSSRRQAQLRCVLGRNVAVDTRDKLARDNADEASRHRHVRSRHSGSDLG